MDLIDDADGVVKNQGLHSVEEGEERWVQWDVSVEGAVEPLVDIVGLVGGSKNRHIGGPVVLHPVLRYIVVQFVEASDNFGCAMDSCEGSDLLSDSLDLSFHVFLT